jgi:hypothetical protein
MGATSPLQQALSNEAQMMGRGQERQLQTTAGQQMKQANANRNFEAQQAQGQMSLGAQDIAAKNRQAWWQVQSNLQNALVGALAGMA